ncbi:MAG: nucleotide exchange factor GrpE [Saprospiraceae bacterium]|nr:nucleotide exchange factor GrpE [Saprospiraceae bacterium]
MENKQALQDEELLQDIADIATEDIENASDNAPNTDATANELAELQAQLEELKDKYLRQVAEFSNFRQRSIREKADTIAMANRDTMTALMPILDDFERASKNETFTEGVNLVHQKLINSLSIRGLKPMESAAGEAFDPEFHEAITEIPAGEALVGKIVDTIEKGYLLNNKIVRHAKVVVGC